jgi:hypothetical protein
VGQQDFFTAFFAAGVQHAPFGQQSPSGQHDALTAFVAAQHAPSGQQSPSGQQAPAVVLGLA